MTTNDPLWRIRQVADFFDCHPDSIRRTVALGKFPEPIRYTAGLKRAVLRWLKSVCVAHKETLQREAAERKAVRSLPARTFADLNALRILAAGGDNAAKEKLGAFAQRHATGKLHEMLASGSLGSELSADQKDEFEAVAALGAAEGLKAWTAKVAAGDTRMLSTFVGIATRRRLVAFQRSPEGPIKEGVRDIPAPGKSVFGDSVQPGVTKGGGEFSVKLDDDFNSVPGEEVTAAAVSEWIGEFNKGTGVMTGTRTPLTIARITQPVEYLRMYCKPADVFAAIETLPDRKDRELMRVWNAKGDIAAYGQLTGQTGAAVNSRLDSTAEALLEMLGESRTERATPHAYDPEAYKGRQRASLVGALISSPTSFRSPRRVTQKAHGKITRKGCGSKEAWVVEAGRICALWDFDNLDDMHKRLPPERRSRREREAYEEANSVCRANAPDVESDGVGDGTCADLFGPAPATSE